MRNCENDLNVLKQKYQDLRQENVEVGQRLRQAIEEEQKLLLEMSEMKERHQEELTSAEARRVNDLSNQAKELNEQFEATTIERENEYNTELASVKNKAEEDYNKLKAEHEQVSESKRLISAELHAIKGSKGLMDDEDFTNEESFEELEKELVAFYDMFVKKWSEAKKKMRNDVLWRRLKKARTMAEEEKDS